jgi:hypothetical protein
LMDEMPIWISSVSCWVDLLAVVCEKFGKITVQAKTSPDHQHQDEPPETSNNCSPTISFPMIGPKNYCMVDEMPIWIPSESFGVDLLAVVYEKKTQKLTNLTIILP